MMKKFMSLFLIYTLSAVSASANESSAESVLGDCALMRGTMIASSALELDSKGYGNIDYWLRSFELIRNNANNVANAITINVIPAVKSELLKTMLEEIVNDIRSAKQSGNGSVSYWTEAVAEQSRVYSRAAEKIGKMKKIACKE